MLVLSDRAPFAAGDTKHLVHQAPEVSSRPFALTEIAGMLQVTLQLMEAEITCDKSQQPGPGDLVHPDRSHSGRQAADLVPAVAGGEGAEVLEDVLRDLEGGFGDL